MNSTNQTAMAILAGAALISASAAATIWATTPRYEIVGTGVGLVARLDRQTGIVDGCIGAKCQPMMPAPSAVQGAPIAPPPGYTLDASPKPAS